MPVKMPVDIPSPCISVCKIDSETLLCVGCFRTVEEIRQWRDSSLDSKKALLEQLHARRQKITGGRARRQNNRKKT